MRGAGSDLMQTALTAAKGCVANGGFGQLGVSYIIGPAPGFALQQLFSVAFYQGIVFEDPTWDYRIFDFDQDVALARVKLANILDATNPDMSVFQNRGAKMIQYHGWIDASPHPRGSIEHYEDVVDEQSPGKGQGKGERKVGCVARRSSTDCLWSPEWSIA